MNYSVLALAVLIVAPATDKKPILPPDRSTACDVSLSFAKTFVKTQGSIIYSSWEGKSSAHPPKSPKYNWGITTYGRQSKAKEPSADILRKFHDQGDLSAVEECPIVKSYLRRNRIEFGMEAVLRATKDAKKSDFLVLSVTLPAVSDDGTMAILSNGQTGVHGGGGGWITAMALDRKGNWKRTFTAPTWIT